MCLWPVVSSAPAVGVSPSVCGCCVVGSGVESPAVWPLSALARPLQSVQTPAARQTVIMMTSTHPHITPVFVWYLPHWSSLPPLLVSWVAVRPCRVYLSLSPSPVSFSPDRLYLSGAIPLSVSTLQLEASARPAPKHTSLHTHLFQFNSIV